MPVDWVYFTYRLFFFLVTSSSPAIVQTFMVVACVNKPFLYGNQQGITYAYGLGYGVCLIRLSRNSYLIHYMYPFGSVSFTHSRASINILRAILRAQYRKIEQQQQQQKKNRAQRTEETSPQSKSNLYSLLMKQNEHPKLAEWEWE